MALWSRMLAVAHMSSWINMGKMGTSDISAAWELWLSEVKYIHIHLRIRIHVNKRTYIYICIYICIDIYIYNSRVEVCRFTYTYLLCVDRESRSLLQKGQQPSSNLQRCWNLDSGPVQQNRIEAVQDPTRSKYPRFQVFGSKNHTLNGFWDQSPSILATWTL